MAAADNIMGVSPTLRGMKSGNPLAAPLQVMEQHAAQLQCKAKDKEKDQKETTADIDGLIYVTEPFPPLEEQKADRRTRPFVVLVAAATNKLNGKPMVQILKRLVKFSDLRVLALDGHMLQDVPIDHWPCCDMLIAFDAKGYPLEKVIAYKNLVRPWVLNDLEIQLSLRDRRNVYHTLREKKIPVAPHIIVGFPFLSRCSFSPDFCRVLGQRRPQVRRRVFARRNRGTVVPEPVPGRPRG